MCNEFGFVSRKILRSNPSNPVVCIVFCFGFRGRAASNDSSKVTNSASSPRRTRIYYELMVETRSSLLF